MKTLVDMMNVVFISSYVTISELRKKGITEFTEKHVGFYLHIFLNKMNSFFTNFGALDICWDGKKSLVWRKSIYPDYKKNREDRRSDISYKTTISTIPKIKEVLELYPCRQIEAEDAEADDLIFALSEKYVNDGEEVTIISSDGDLGQIINFFGDKVSQFHPIRKKYLKPSKYLIDEKAIVGDISDNIHGVYRIGIKTFEKMLVDEDFWNKKMSESNNKVVYESLKKIIDLRKFPYKDKILEEEKNIVYNEFKPDNIELFFWDNKLKDLLSRWSSLKEGIKVYSKEA